MTLLPGKQVRKAVPFSLIPSALLLLFISTVPLSSAASGPEILAQARDVIRSQDLSITGQLRTEGQRVPFRLTQKNGVTTYVFADPAETIAVALSDSGVEITGPKDRHALVRGSLITYDDLTLSFLFWTDIKELGIEKVGPLPCWKLRLAAPDRTSAYAVVHLWVNQQSGAFLRARAFDFEGNPVKEFTVISTQKIGGRYFLKQMRIQNSKPAKGEAEITYLEIDKAG